MIVQIFIVRRSFQILLISDNLKTCLGKYWKTKRTIGYFHRTVFLTMIPVHPYFSPKSVEYDVTVTSFKADLSGPRKLIGQYVRRINRRKGYAKLVAISALLFCAVEK